MEAATHGTGVLRRVIGHAFLGGVIGGIVGYCFIPFLLLHPDVFDALRRHAAPPGLDLQPADVPWACAAIGAAVFAVLQFFERPRNDERGARGVSGVQAAASSDARDEALIASLKRHFTGNAGFALSSVVRMEKRGMPVSVGDVVLTWGGDGGSSVQTMAFCETDALRFPRFRLCPAGAATPLLANLIRDQHVGFPAHALFSKAYVLTADDEADVHRLFTARVLAHLGSRPGFCIQSAPRCLALYRPEIVCGPKDLETFVDEAAAIFRLIEDAARSAGMAADRPPARKRDIGAIVAKMRGLSGMDARRDLVTRADVDAFVGQAPPRRIPANIGRYADRFAPGDLVLFGLVFAAIGAALAYGSVYPALAGGRSLLSTEGLHALFAVLFLGVGVPIVFFTRRSRYRIHRVLRRGRMATATIESVEAMPSSGVFRLTVRYRAADSDTRASCRIIRHGVERAADLAAGGKPAAILYDPAVPGRILFVDDLISVGADYEP